MKNLRNISLTIGIILIVELAHAQAKVYYGKVYAFKDLPLNNIQVEAKKAKTKTMTDSLGYFRINCEEKDRLEFSGEGFQKEKIKPDEKTRLEVKLIFRGSNKNVQKAVEAGHVEKDRLMNSIEHEHEYNFEYYNYASIFEAIDKLYEDNYDIEVRGGSVYVRPDNKSSFPTSPAVFIVNGRLALDLSTIQTRDIKLIKVIPDGSARYGARAANGAVLISTSN